MRTRFIATALCVALSACASLDPTTISKLAALDIMTTDPSRLSVAAVMPAPIRLRTGDVVLHLAYEAPAPYGPIDETIALAVNAGEGAPGIVAKPGVERIQTARIATADIPRLKAALAKAAAFRETGGHGKGSLSVTITGGCRDGALKNTPLIAAIYMRTTPDEPYFPLVASLDFRKVVGEAALAKLPPCAMEG